MWDGLQSDGTPNDALHHTPTQSYAVPYPGVQLPQGRGGCCQGPTDLKNSIPHLKSQPQLVSRKAVCFFASLRCGLAVAHFLVRDERRGTDTETRFVGSEWQVPDLEA
jgi:hypothetical protein